MNRVEAGVGLLNLLELLLINAHSGKKKTFLCKIYCALSEARASEGREKGFDSM